MVYYFEEKKVRNKSLNWYLGTRISYQNSLAFPKSTLKTALIMLKL